MNPCDHDKKFWRVPPGRRNANYSAFQAPKFGYKWSAYSDVLCLACGSIWRTKAAYVDQLPNMTPKEIQEQDDFQGNSCKVRLNHVFEKRMIYKGCPDCEYCFFDKAGTCLKCGKPKAVNPKEFNEWLGAATRGSRQ